MRVAIIEDDKRLANLIQRVLEDEHFQTTVVHDGESGLELLLTGLIDVAIIDWMLPGRDGPSICRAVRSRRLRTALLMLTARGQVEDRVRGLQDGADDYLVKPFAFDELVARVKALSRRFTIDLGDGDELRVGDIVMDLRSHSVRRGIRSLDLTPTEWTLLEFLLRNRGQTLSRQQILDYVWATDRDVLPTMVDIYVSYLRRKLNQNGELDPIRTQRGFGYRLELPPA